MDGQGQGLYETAADTALSDKQRLFLDWLTGDRPDGEGQNEFGRRIGVEGWQLAKWKRQPTFLTAWEKRMLRTHASPAVLSDTLATLREIMEHGRNEADKIKAVDLYWKLCEKMAPGGVIVRPVSVEERDVNDLTDEEIQAALGAS